MDFGERLTLERRRRHLNQEEIANAVGVSRHTYALYEKSKLPPKSDQRLSDLANAVGCKKEDLLGERTDLTKSISEVLVVAARLIIDKMDVSSLTAAFLSFANSNRKLTDHSMEDVSDRASRPEEGTEEAAKQQRVFRKKAYGLIASTLTEKKYKWNNSAQGTVSLFETDLSFDLTDEPIKNWWFCCYSLDGNNHTDQSWLKAVVGIMLMKYVMIPPDKHRMVSFVVDDEGLYNSFVMMKDRNSYKGNLSVILISTKEMEVINEKQISWLNEEGEEALPCLGADKEPKTC